MITLTTDFGEGSPYVAAMKGVILSVNPAVSLVDLSHRIPPQNIPHASYFLASAVPYFLPGTLHVVVVDPGVGTERALLHVEVEGQQLLVPDNGCWTSLIRERCSPTVIRLAEPRYWRQPVSDTFHGRDILAPAAGHLSLGVDPRLLGPVVTEYVRWNEPKPWCSANNVIGEVVFVDQFGNLITNIRNESIPGQPEKITHVFVGNHEVPRQVRTYGEVEPGTLVSLVSSNGRLEIAVVGGSAAERLGLGAGTCVNVRIGT